MSPDDDGWWSDHGVAADVRDARPYVRYRKGERAPIARWFADCELSQTRWALNKARHADGLVMVKHPLAGLPPIAPQLRPDVEIRNRKSLRHHHPAADAWAMREHILRHSDHRGLNSKQRGQITDAEARALLWLYNDEAPHEHVGLAKYLLTIKPRKPWLHDHLVYADRPGRLAKHLRRHHDGADITGEHDHPGRTLEDDDPWRSPGRRIDVHPFAAKLLPDAELVFFGIEGVIKTDAILTAIRCAGLSASVVGVPSVGQWDTPELAHLADICAGKTMVIVADADGRDNAQVMGQALLLRSQLRRLGLRACVALPPYGAFQADERIKGVDDFLGLHGGDLLDLEVVGVELQAAALAAWTHAHARRELYGKRVRRDAVAADLQALMGLLILGGVEGRTHSSLGKVARYLGVPADRVERAVHRLIAAGAVRADKPLETGRWLYRTNRYRDPALDWSERPSIEIVDPALWAIELPVVPLRAWLAKASNLDNMQSAVREGDEIAQRSALASSAFYRRSLTPRKHWLPRQRTPTQTRRRPSSRRLSTVGTPRRRRKLGPFSPDGPMVRRAPFSGPAGPLPTLVAAAGSAAGDSRHKIAGRPSRRCGASGRCPVRCGTPGRGSGDSRPGLRAHHNDKRSNRGCGPNSMTEHTRIRSFWRWG